MFESETAKTAQGGRLSSRTIQEAAGGDVLAMGILLRHFDSYIRRLATLNARGTSYLNEDLYEGLKTRLIIETLRFEPRQNGAMA